MPNDRQTKKEGFVMQKFSLLLVGVLAWALMVPVTVPAAGVPERDITLVVPWAAGGGTDTLGRTLVKNGKKYFGVNINVDVHPEVLLAVLHQGTAQRVGTPSCRPGYDQGDVTLGESGRGYSDGNHECPCKDANQQQTKLLHHKALLFCLPIIRHVSEVLLFSLPPFR